MEDVEKLFSDFQERHDGKHDSYLLEVKRIMENNQ